MSNSMELYVKIFQDNTMDLNTQRQTLDQFKDKPENTGAFQSQGLHV